MTYEPINNFEKRLQRIEDQLAIYQIIGAYGAAADSNNIEMMCSLYHEDCELVIAGHGTYKGHKGVTDVIMGDYHQMLVTSGSGHTTSLPNVQIDGDRAIATVYSMLFLLRDEKFILERLAAARWEFIRTADGWRIIKRTTEPMLGTNQNAKDLLRRVLKIA
jgi:hypothetical protein